MAVSVEQEIGIVEKVKELVNLQLVGAAVGTNGQMSVRQLFQNIKRFADLDMGYGDFISTLESIRSEFDIRDGQIGADVTYITLKKG